jgi:uncharacterized protein (TIGR02117 family)
MLKRIITYIKTGLLVIGLTMAFYLLTAFTLSVISTNPDHLVCQKENEIFIASNGVHLDLIVSRHYLTPKLLNSLELPNGVNYIAFGWGDKEFYINTPGWSDLKFRTTFKALFLDSESAIHITWIKNEYPGWAVVPMCDIQLQLLIEYLDGTFKKSPSNNIVEIEASGYTQYDKFYEAIGSFNGIRTCNNWVNDALKAAKVKTSIWSPFDQGVLYQAKKNTAESYTQLIR